MKIQSSFKTVALIFMVASAIPALCENTNRVKNLLAENVIWRNIGPGGGGWLQSMLASQHKPERMFIGCDVGGFFISENGGRTYEIRNHGLQNMYIETIAEHPTDPNTIFIGSLSGVYRTRDLGRHWEELRNGFPPPKETSYAAPISRIVFSRRNPNIIYAAVGQPRIEKHGRGAIYRSTDGGDSWKQIVEPGQLDPKLGIYDLALDVDGPDSILISTPSGLFRSADGGRTWSPSNTGLPDHLRTRRMAQSPSNPNIIYLTLRHKGGETPWRAGVYKSTDGGRNWTACNNGIPQQTGKPGSYDKLCSWMDHIQVHPTNPDIAYAGGATWWTPGIYKTTDGGKSWVKTFKKADQGWLTWWGATVASFSVSAKYPDTLIFGNSGYVYRSTDGGDTWRQCYTEERTDGMIAGSGLEVTCLHTIVADRVRKGKFYIGYYDIGLFITEDGGKTMRRAMNGIPEKFANSCFTIAQSPVDPDLLWGSFGSWATGKGIIAKSTDGGKSWTPCADKETLGYETVPRSFHCVLDRDVTRFFSGVGKHGLLTMEATQDASPVWKTIPPSQIHPSAVKVESLTLDGKSLYVGVADNDGKTTHLLKSADFGKTWQDLTPADAHWGNQNKIVVKDNLLLLTTRSRYENKHFTPGGAYLSTDKGLTWKKIYKDNFCGAAMFLGDRLIMSLHDHPYHDHSVGGGLICTRDLGKTWTTFNSDSLQNWNISVLCADPFNPRSIWAGTGGNSVFIGTLPE